MSRPRALVASTDRTLPTKYVGKVESNYLCRGWRAKKQSYCPLRAGYGTTHKGVGRCKYHGGLQEGDRRVTNGSRSVVMRTTLGELIEQERNRADPLDLSGELATLRALVADLRNRNPDVPDHTSEIALANSIGVMVERITKMQSSMSRVEVNRLVQALWREVEARMSDDELRRETVQAWHRVGLGLS